MSGVSAAPDVARVSIVSLATRAEMQLSGDELAAAAGISPARLARLVRLGLVEPTAPGTSRFTAATAARLRRMLRLHGDLGVNLVGAAIIVDLLERLERLRRGAGGAAPRRTLRRCGSTPSDKERAEHGSQPVDREGPGRDPPGAEPRPAPRPSADRRRAPGAWRCSARTAAWPPRVVEKAGGDPAALVQRLQQAIERLPRVSGPGRPRARSTSRPAWTRSLRGAEAEAQRMKDEYVSVEHLLLALAGLKDGAVAEAFRAAGLTARRSCSRRSPPCAAGSA